jgi:hypothetical protein
MEVQRVEEDEDFKEFEESFFDELVTSTQEGDSPSTPRQRFFGSLLDLHFVHLCNEYGEPHYSLNGWWHGHKLVIWTKLMACISMCRWSSNKCCWGAPTGAAGSPNWCY